MHRRNCLHILPAAAQTYTTYRAGIQVIDPDRQLEMLTGIPGVIGNIKTFPAVINPGFYPGMGRHVLTVLGIQITADVTCRDAEAATTGQENMAVILADAAEAAL